MREVRPHQPCGCRRCERRETGRVVPLADVRATVFSRGVLRRSPSILVRLLIVREFGWQQHGELPKRPKGSDCKSAVFDFGGSNPSLATSVNECDVADAARRGFLWDIVLGTHFDPVAQLAGAPRRAEALVQVQPWSQGILEVYVLRT